MKCMAGTWLVAVSIFCVAGCGSSSTPSNVSAAPDAAGPAATGTLSQTTTGDTPSGVVAAFYDALRSGDKAAIAELLTEKAKTETAKSGLGIQSQGSDRLAYELGEVDYITEAMDGAHVKSLWIDYDDEDQQLATEVIWVLRKQSDGWRVAGMATQVVEGQLPLLFNFEDPEDMLQKKEYIETQFAGEYSAEFSAQQADSAPDAQVVR